METITLYKHVNHTIAEDWQTDQKLLWSLWNNDSKKANSNAQVDADYLRAIHKSKKEKLPIKYETRRGYCKLSIEVLI